MRKAVRTSAPERVDAQSGSSRLSEDDTSISGQADLFHEDEGGLRAKDGYNQPLDRHLLPWCYRHPHALQHSAKSLSTCGRVFRMIR